MQARGITIKPIIEMTGGHTFNEVFFDEVRIPAENLVGEVNDGWRLAKVTLSNERVSLSGGGLLWGNGPTVFELIELVKAQGGTTDQIMRQRLVECWMMGRILDLVRARTLSARVAGKEPGPEASVRKALADDHGQAVYELAVDLAGAHGMLTGGGPLGSEDPMWSFGFLFAQALTIGGGTFAVQRNIIGERVLGLPHEPDIEAGMSWSQTRRTKI